MKKWGGEAMIDNFAIAIAVSMTLTGLSVAVSGVGVKNFLYIPC